MKHHLTFLAKFIVFVVATLGVLALSPSVARADEVFISGYTNGCFNCASPPDTSTLQVDSLLGNLLYTNATFSGTTANGFRGIGENAQAPFFQSGNNLGSFHLSDSERIYDGNTFTLRVTFTTPHGIDGSNQVILITTLIGTVRPRNQGGIFIDFDNTPILFTFTDTNCEPDGVRRQNCGQGSFLFTVNDMSMGAFGFAGISVAPLTGHITSAQQTSVVPEPGTLLLLGTGLTGIAAKLRQRKKTRAEKS